METIILVPGRRAGTEAGPYERAFCRGNPLRLPDSLWYKLSQTLVPYSSGFGIWRTGRHRGHPSDAGWPLRVGLVYSGRAGTETHPYATAWYWEQPLQDSFL